MLAMSTAAPAAAPSLAEQLKLCAAEADPARRLSCYDLLAAQPAPAIARPAVPQPGSQTIAPTVPAVPTVPAAVADTAKDAANSAEFGVSNGPLAVKRQVKSINHISAVVTNITTRPRGELIVTLDNGQVWEQIATADYFPLKAGDTVEISSGALGSYVLAAPSRRYTKVTRIR
jgi:hypothetical protein